ncbi:hypothetical protein PFISCL1PPCAC_22368 [Pristionchus fissidentatus]|uniref:Protein-L-isoaspartate O-methyltransferase n=1 Tax=Pristionchus fissidentatus TaxID=1538716 RepID=A0AAV5WJH5_9BILA|nr:hypothetical protein PFISCL1PPCAC_22368 [Pristionchus fissidentatus]
MGSKPNAKLVDDLVGNNNIRTEKVERVFRLVDRGIFASQSDPQQIYRDAPYRTNGQHPGQIHISAPSIYCTVLEVLDVHKGQSFLNVGSGSGYLSSLVGFLIGDAGCNHGVEIYSNVVEHARDCINRFSSQKFVAGYDWCRPEFVHGNALAVQGVSKRYDRIYVGAQIDEATLPFFSEMLKEGGILVVPIRVGFETFLQRTTRTAEGFEHKDFMHVAFAEIITISQPGEGERRERLPSVSRKRKEDDTNPNPNVSADLLALSSPRSLEMLAALCIRQTIADGLRMRLPIAITHKLKISKTLAEVFEGLIRRHDELRGRDRAVDWLHNLMRAGHALHNGPRLIPARIIPPPEPNLERLITEAQMEQRNAQANRLLRDVGMEEARREALARGDTNIDEAEEVLNAQVAIVRAQRELDHANATVQALEERQTEQRMIEMQLRLPPHLPPADPAARAAAFLRHRREDAAAAAAAVAAEVEMPSDEDSDEEDREARALFLANDERMNEEHLDRADREAQRVEQLQADVDRLHEMQRLLEMDEEPFEVEFAIQRQLLPVNMAGRLRRAADAIDMVERRRMRFNDIRRDDSSNDDSSADESDENTLAPTLRIGRRRRWTCRGCRRGCDNCQLSLKVNAGKVMDDYRNAHSFRASRNIPWVKRMERLTSAEYKPKSFADAATAAMNETINPMPNGRYAIEDWFLKRIQTKYHKRIAALLAAVNRVGDAQFRQEKDDFDKSLTVSSLPSISFENQHESLLRFEKEMSAILQSLPLPVNGKKILRWNLLRED